MIDYNYQCQECEHFRQMVLGGKWVSFCIKDIDNIKEVQGYNDVCEEPGELFGEIDAFPSMYKRG